MSDYKKYALLSLFVLYFGKCLVFSAGYPDALLIFALAASYLFTEYKTSEKKFQQLIEALEKLQKETSEKLERLQIDQQKLTQDVHSIRFVKQINEKGIGIR